jgi:hypothetical protein
VIYTTRPGLESMIYHTRREHTKQFTTRPGLEHVIYHTRREHTNHYTTCPGLEYCDRSWVQDLAVWCNG